MTIKVPITEGVSYDKPSLIIGNLELYDSERIMDLLKTGEMTLAPTFLNNLDGTVTLISISLIGRRVGLSKLTIVAPELVLPEMKKYTFYWLDGTKSILEGHSVEDAFRKGGYNNGAVNSLDFTMNGEDDSYSWISHRWIKMK